MRDLRRIIARHRVDIVHLNNNTPRDLFGMLVSRSSGVVCVSHLRTEPLRDIQLRSVYRLANDVVFKYVAISDYIRKRWVQCGMDENKCRVIHNGIPSLDVKAPDLRRRYGLGEVDTIVCTIGRLVAWKNHAFLIRGFAEYHERHPSSALIVVGEGPEEHRLRRLAEELGIAGDVHFTGHREDAKEILAGSDIFVLASKDEPFGRVTLEAMALGVPVVATRSGGSPEIVRDGGTGLLVAPGDTNELRVVLEMLTEDDARTRRLVDNAYESTRTRFHIRNCVTAIEEIYAAA